jgi:YbbR domain-containing protein
MTWSSRLVSLLLNNFWLKFVSLSFAFVLFVIVRTEQVREFNLTGRVKIVTAKNVVVVGAQERAVEIQLKLPNSLFSLPPGDEELVGILDVSEQSVGKIRVRLSRYNFPNLDERYTVTVLDPWIEVDLDEVVSKSVAVRAVLQGLPSSGLSIERVIVNPEEVEVTGARRELDTIETLSTSPVNIDGIDQNFSAITKIELTETSSIKVTSDKVNVQVFVGRDRRNRTFLKVPIEVKNADGEVFQVTPPTITVELRGADHFLRQMSNESITAFVDASEFSGPDALQKVWLKIPADTSLVRVQPDRVRVRKR